MQTGSLCFRLICYKMSVLIVCFTRLFQDSCNLYCFRMSGSQYGVGWRCDWITIGSFWFGGGLYQTNTKSGSGSDSNKGGSSYTSYFDGSYSYKNPVNSSVWFIHFTDRVLQLAGLILKLVPLWLTSWIPTERPLHHSRREQWRSGVQQVQS